MSLPLGRDHRRKGPRLPPRRLLLPRRQLRLRLSAPKPNPKGATDPMAVLKDGRFWAGIVVGALLIIFFPQLNVLRKKSS